MPQFRLATATDLPRLTALWQEAFGDAPEVIRSFWERCFDKIKVFCLFEDKALCAMACALPLQYIDADGESHRCPYFYAVATAKKWQNRGLCRSLLTQAEAQLKKDGAVLCCLVPGEERLFSFYERLGYRNAFTCSRQKLPAQKAEGVRLRRIDADQYENLRQMQLYGEFISYPDFLLQLQQQAGLAGGAGLYRLESSELVCVAAAEKQGQLLQIKEMLPPDEALAAHLADQLGCEAVLLQSCGEESPFAMAKALQPISLPENAYLGLAFD